MVANCTDPLVLSYCPLFPTRCAYLIEKAMESEQQLAETETLCPGPLVESSQDSCLEMNVSDEEVEKKEMKMEEKLKEKIAAAKSVTESDYRKQRKGSEMEKNRSWEIVTTCSYY